MKNLGWFQGFDQRSENVNDTFSIEDKEKAIQLSRIIKRNVSSNSILNLIVDTRSESHVRKKAYAQTKTSIVSLLKQLGNSLEEQAILTKTQKLEFVKHFFTKVDNYTDTLNNDNNQNSSSVTNSQENEGYRLSDAAIEHKQSINKLKNEIRNDVLSYIEEHVKSYSNSIKYIRQQASIAKERKRENIDLTFLKLEDIKSYDQENVNNLTKRERVNLYLKLLKYIKTKEIELEKSTDYNDLILTLIDELESSSTLLNMLEQTYPNISSELGIIDSHPFYVFRMFKILSQRKLEVIKRLSSSNITQNERNKLIDQIEFIERALSKFLFSFNKNEFLDINSALYFSKFVQERFLDSSTSSPQKIKIMESLLNDNSFHYIEGDTGVGKTVLAKEVGDMFFGQKIFITKLQELYKSVKNNQHERGDKGLWFYGEFPGIQTKLGTTTNFSTGDSLPSLAQMIIETGIKYVVLDELSQCEPEYFNSLKTFLNQVKDYNNKNPDNFIKVVFTGNPISLSQNLSSIPDFVLRDINQIRLGAPDSLEYYSIFLNKFREEYGVSLPNEFIKVSTKTTEEMKTSIGSKKIDHLDYDYKNSNHGNIAKLCIFLDRYNTTRFWQLYNIPSQDEEKLLKDFNKQEVNLPLTFNFFNDVIYKLDVHLRTLKDISITSYNIVLECAILEALSKIPVIQKNKASFEKIVSEFELIGLISKDSASKLKSLNITSNYIDSMLNKARVSKSTEATSYTEFTEVFKHLNFIAGGVEVSGNNPPVTKNLSKCRIIDSDGRTSVQENKVYSKFPLKIEGTNTEISPDSYIFVDNKLVKYLGFNMLGNDFYEVVVDNQISGTIPIYQEVYIIEKSKLGTSIQLAIQDQSIDESDFKFFDTIEQKLTYQSTIYQKFGVRPIYPNKNEILALHKQFKDLQDKSKYTTSISLGFEIDTYSINNIVTRLKDVFLKELDYELEISEEAKSKLSEISKVNPILKLEQVRTNENLGGGGFEFLSILLTNDQINSSNSANIFTSLFNLYYILLSSKGKADLNSILKGEVDNYSQEQLNMLQSIITQTNSGIPNLKNCYVGQDLVIQYLPGNPNGSEKGRMRIVTASEIKEESNDVLKNPDSLAPDCITEFKFNI